MRRSTLNFLAERDISKRKKKDDRSRADARITYRRSRNQLDHSEASANSGTSPGSERWTALEGTRLMIALWGCTWSSLPGKPSAACAGHGSLVEEEEADGSREHDLKPPAVYSCLQGQPKCQARELPQNRGLPSTNTPPAVGLNAELRGHQASVFSLRLVAQRPPGCTGSFYIPHEVGRLRSLREHLGFHLIQLEHLGHAVVLVDPPGPVGIARHAVRPIASKPSPSTVR